MCNERPAHWPNALYLDLVSGRRDFGDRLVQIAAKPEEDVMLPLLNRPNCEKLLILLAMSAGGGSPKCGALSAAMPVALRHL